MSTTPRLASAVDGAPANIVTVRRHAPAVMAAFDAMYAVLLGGGVAGMDVKEAMRLRNAMASGCGLWRQVRFAQAREAGLTEDHIAHLDAAARTTLPTRLQVALGWADMLLAGGHNTDPTLHAQMREHFSDAQIVELTYAMGTFIGYGKQIMILGLEPDDLPITVVPTPGA